MPAETSHYEQIIKEKQDGLTLCCQHWLNTINHPSAVRKLTQSLTYNHQLVCSASGLVDNKTL